MLKNIKQKIRQKVWRYLLSTIQEDEYEFRGEMFERLLELEDFNKLLSLLVRDQLRGIHYYGVDLMEGWSKEKEKTFLQNVYDLKHNKSFGQISRFLIKHQIDFTSKEAINMDELNFGRATINGITLFVEEVERWYAEWEKQNKPEAKYDKQAIFDNDE